MTSRWWLAIACLVLAGAPAALAQENGAQPAAEQTPPPDSPTPPVDPNSPEGQSIETAVLPPSAYVEGERPPAKEKIYDTKQAKVWAAALDVMKKADVPVESADEAAGVVKTQLIQFDFKRFFDVATRPPTLSRERPIYQILRLNQGWFSVEIHVAKVKKGTSVSIRAYLEENARDIGHMRRVRAERYSNGKVEDYFFAKLDEALK